jgi:hypothetical protein
MSNAQLLLVAEMGAPTTACETRWHAFRPLLPMLLLRQHVLLLPLRTSGLRSLPSVALYAARRTPAHIAHQQPGRDAMSTVTSRGVLSTGTWTATVQAIAQRYIADSSRHLDSVQMGIKYSATIPALLLLLVLLLQSK